MYTAHAAAVLPCCHSIIFQRALPMARQCRLGLFSLDKMSHAKMVSVSLCIAHILTWRGPRHVVAMHSHIMKCL